MEAALLREIERRNVSFWKGRFVGNLLAAGIASRLPPSTGAAPTGFVVR
jgi:hypothetical protein